MSSIVDYFDCRNSGKVERKYKPYIRCEICLRSEKTDHPDYVHCTYYKMLSKKSSTCKAAIKNEN